MKILLISTPWLPTPPITHGGVERDVACLAKEFVKLGHIVTIIAAKGSNVPGCKIIEAYNRKENEQVLDQIVFWRNVIQYMESNKHDVVNSHTSLLNMPYDTINDLSQKRLCVSIHYEERVAPRNNIFISEAQQKALKSCAKYIHNPIDANIYTFCTEKDNYFTFVGRIHFEKGADIAIKIAKDTNVPLKLAGNIDDKIFFDTKISPHLNNSIQYVGEVNDQQKSDLLSKSRAVLYPTRVNPEAFGLVPLEANACGTPAIAFRSGGLKEVIKDGETGFLVDTIGEMIAAVTKVKDIDPVICRKWVEDNFKPEIISNKYLQLYEELINGNNWG
jgi:glycosyltransferase involved in cell wall biosynthesis